MNLQFLKNNDPRLQPGIKEVEEKIEELRWLDTREQEKVWQELNEIFFDVPDRSNNPAWRAIWYWYTDFSWKMLKSRPPIFFSELAIGRQVPMAVMLGFDVLDLIFRYLYFRTIDQANMESVYGRARGAFLQSPAIIGQIDGQDFIVADLVKKLRYFSSVKNNSLAEAKFHDDLTRAMFPKEEFFLNKYFIEDKEIAVTQMLNVADFFIGVEPDGIWYLVEDYAREKFPVVSDGPETLSPSSTGTPVNTAPDYREIVRDMEKKYPRDSEGNLTDVEKVFADLQNLAERYNDPKINELYYFDEASGKFKWNV